MRPSSAALLSVLLAAACGDDSGATGATAASSTNSATATSSTSTTDSTDSTAATTGLELCNFGSSGGSGGAPGPWLELYASDELLVDGATLHLLCGGQGTFMFEVRPKFGGFTPTGDFVSFDVTLDIEGHAGPTGHFSSTTPEIYVACDADPFDFNISTFQMLVFDDLDSVSELDGLPGHLQVSFVVDGETLTQDLDLTIDAAQNPSWDFCIDGDTWGTTDDSTTTDATTTDATTTGTTGP